MKINRLVRLGVFALAFVLAAPAVYAQSYRMSGSVELLAGRTQIRKFTGQAIVPNTNNGATLMIPAGAFGTAGNKFLVFPTIPTVVQVSSSFSSSNQAETLMAGGGPPAFDFCPQNNFDCTLQSDTEGDGYFGTLQYRTGNSFGGTFRIMRNVFNAAVSRVAGTAPLQVNHQPTTDPQPWGAGHPFGTGAGPPLFTGATIFRQNNGPVPQGVLTQSPGLGPFGSVQTPGTVVPGGGLLQPTAFETAFPATTGEIFMQDSIGSAAALATFTDIGSDMRDSNGFGTITLVASGFSNNLNTEVFPSRLLIEMVFSPEVPTMGAPGIAVLGALIILGGGYMLKRRL